jgi:hypothetical protein
MLDGVVWKEEGETNLDHIGPIDENIEIYMIYIQRRN